MSQVPRVDAVLLIKKNIQNQTRNKTLAWPGRTVVKPDKHPTLEGPNSTGLNTEHDG